MPLTYQLLQDTRHSSGLPTALLSILYFAVALQMGVWVTNSEVMLLFRALLVMTEHHACTDAAPLKPKYQRVIRVFFFFF